MVAYTDIFQEYFKSNYEYLIDHLDLSIFFIIIPFINH